MPAWAVLICKDCGKEFKDEATGVLSMLGFGIDLDRLPACPICTSRDVEVKSIECYVPGIDERRNKEEESE